MRLSIPLEPRRGQASRAQRIAVILLALLVVVAGWLVSMRLRYPTASPLTSTSYVLRQIGQSHARMEKQVIGFLPYWQEDQLGNVRMDLVSELVYFALTADQDGHIVTQAKGGGQEPGWRAWQSSTVGDEIARAQIAGTRVSLAVAMTDGVQLGAFLDDARAQQALVDTLAGEVADKRLDGLNLDFEFQGASTPAHREAFTRFSRGLVSAIHARAPGSTVSIDLPATSAQKPGLYDVAALGSIFDRVIVMSYDYYVATSDVAGPVAPVSGYADHTYFFDVTTAYDQFTQAVPASKLVMGVPYYGYDWPVKDNSKPLALTLPQNDANGYAQIVSYSRLQTDAALRAATCAWEAKAQETWCAYTDPKTNTAREAWVMDDRAISARFDFAAQRSLAGVAIWTLGYQGSKANPWQLIRQHFTAA